MWLSRKYFFLEMVIVWNCKNDWMMQNGSFYWSSPISINICSWKRMFFTENWDLVTHATFSPNVHWWANMVAKDSNISHYLNLSINSPMIALLWYTPNMIILHKLTQIFWLELTNEFAISHQFAAANHQIFRHLWGTIMHGPYRSYLNQCCHIVRQTSQTIDARFFDTKAVKYSPVSMIK